MSGKPKNQRASEIVIEAVKNINKALSSDDHNRIPALDDLKMKIGDRVAHWSDDKTNFKTQREDDERVCLVINRLPSLSDQVSGDIKANMPSCKIHPADDQAIQKTADIMEGRIRCIEAESDAESHYDEAGQQVIDTGFGAWRIVTEYADENSFQQIARVKPIHNQFAVIWDPIAQEYDKTDGEWVGVLTQIHKDTYKRKYKGKIPTSFEVNRGTENWYSTDVYTICEYFRKENAGSKTIYMLPVEEEKLLPDVLAVWLRIKTENNYKPGQTVEQIPIGFEEYWEGLVKEKLVRERKVSRRKIVRYLLSGHEILEDAQDWLDDIYWPIVPALGKVTNINGKVYVQGVLRGAKDSQKAYNFGWSTSVEEVAMTPKAPAYVTADQIRGYEPIWDNAHKTILPYLPYNPDPMAPGPPVKPPVAQASTAVTEINMRAIDDMRAITNVFDPSMQQPTPDMSGKAVLARVSRSGISNYVYIYNIARSRALTWKILVRILPKIEDTKMKVKLRSIDGKTTEEKINWPNDQYGMKPEEPAILNDLSLGRYDVSVTIGPSYATQRMEAAENLTKILQFMPEQMRVALIDFILKNFDYHGIPDVVDRIHLWQVKNGMGYFLSPEDLKKAMQKIAQSPQQPPNPMMIMKLKEMGAKALNLTAKAEESMAKTGKLKAEVGKMMMEAWQELGMMVMGVQGQQQGQPGQMQGPQQPMPGMM